MPIKKGDWVIRPWGPDGALTNTQVCTLSKNFSISEQHVRALSKAIAYPLSPNFFVGSVVEVLKWREKGPEELDSLIKNIHQAEVRLGKAAAQIDRISIQFPNVGEGVEDPNICLRDELDDSLKKVKFIRRALEQSTKKYSANFRGEPDNKKNRYSRHWSVLFAILDTWEASGRKEVYTSDGITSKRSGPLVDFTNEVVSYVTDPIMEIKGETVRRALDKWRHCRALEDKVYRSEKND